MLQDPAFVDEAPETGYRLCYLGASPEATPTTRGNDTYKIAR